MKKRREAQKCRKAGSEMNKGWNRNEEREEQNEEREEQKCRKAGTEMKKGRNI